MRKIMFIGRSEAGKTTLSQAMKGKTITYHKTQYVNHYIKRHKFIPKYTCCEKNVYCEENCGCCPGMNQGMNNINNQ